MIILAVKGRPQPNNSNFGYIQPKFIIQDNDVITTNKDQFPNTGEIFITTNYRNSVEDFGDDEIFKVKNANEADNFEEDNLGSCKYISRGFEIEKLKPLEYNKIYQIPIDLEKRVIRKSSLINFNKTGTKPFFIQYEDYLYGPFKLIDNEPTYVELDDIFNETDNTDNSVLYEFIEKHKECIFKIELSSINNDIKGEYLSNFETIINKGNIDFIYWGDKNSIINWGKRFLTGIDENDKKVLSKIFTYNIPTFNDPLDSQKISLFKYYLQDADDFIKEKRPILINEYFAEEKGKEYLKNYLDENKDKLLTEYRKEEIAKIDSDIEFKKHEKTNLEENISKIKLELKEKENQILRPQFLDESEFAILEKYLSNSDSKKLFFNLLQNQPTDIEEKITEKKVILKYVEEEIREKQSTKNAIDKSIEEVLNGFRNKEDLYKNVIQSQVIADILNGIPINKSSIRVNHSSTFNYIPPKIQRVNYSEPKKFIEDIRDSLTSYGRSFEMNEVVNLIVSLHQNFLLILAGHPGVGKTSLVEILSKILGLYGNDRFNKIAVSKGWSSSKDLIGYYNPLTKTYQEAKTGLLASLKNSALDCEHSHKTYNLLLLDEANLSPIEHYWSDFIPISDWNYNKQIEIPKHEGKESLIFGDCVRFISTVNYDHTTEILSERILSRAPVIKINTLANWDVDYNARGIDNSDKGCIDYNAIDELLKEEVKLSRDLEIILKAIFEVSTKVDNQLGNPIPLSPRKYGMIDRYCKVASKLMAKPMDALDYSVAQHVLPMINGRGQNFTNRLDSLQEKLNNSGLNKSFNILKNIKESGDSNFKHYSYFNI